MPFRTALAPEDAPRHAPPRTAPLSCWPPALPLPASTRSPAHRRTSSRPDTVNEFVEVVPLPRCSAACSGPGISQTPSPSPPPGVCALRAAAAYLWCTAWNLRGLRDIRPHAVQVQEKCTALPFDTDGQGCHPTSSCASAGHQRQLNSGFGSWWLVNGAERSTDNVWPCPGGAPAPVVGRCL